MNYFLRYLPLYTGLFLLQIPPAVTSVPSTITDLLLQTLSQVPVYVILAYIVINIQRTTAKENERRDGHEVQITNILDAQIKRVDEIEEDRRTQWGEQKHADETRDAKYIETFQAFADGQNRVADVLMLLQKDATDQRRILSDLTSGVTTMVTVGSKPLQQVVKDVGALQETSEEIQKVVSELFNRYVTVFPTNKSMDERFEELKKAIIDAIDKACAEKKIATQEVSAVTNIINTGTPAPVDAGKAADAPALGEVA